MSKARDMANLLTGSGKLAGARLDNSTVNVALFGASAWTLSNVSTKLVLSYNGTAKAKLETGSAMDSLAGRSSSSRSMTSAAPIRTSQSPLRPHPNRARWDDRNRRNARTAALGS